MEASSQDEAFSFASAFVIPRWTLSGCERTTISRAGGTSQLASWRVSLDRCEIVTGDAVYNHQYGYLNCQKRTTMSSSSIRKHASTISTGVPVVGAAREREDRDHQGDGGASIHPALHT